MNRERKKKGKKKRKERGTKKRTRAMKFQENSRVILFEIQAVRVKEASKIRQIDETMTRISKGGKGPPML